MVPCICSECINNKNPFLFQIQKINRYLKKGRNEITCDISVENIEINRLIEGFYINNSIIREEFQIYEKPKVFISYATKDIKIVRKIVYKLLEENIDIWFDENEIKPGDSIVNKINNGLFVTNVVLIVLTKNALESNWVNIEINSAFSSLMSNDNVKIIPLILEKLNIPPLLNSFLHIDLSKNFDLNLKKLGKYLMTNLNTI